MREGLRCLTLSVYDESSVCPVPFCYLEVFDVAMFYFANVLDSRLVADWRVTRARLDE